jgi:hypothetical protein
MPLLAFLTLLLTPIWNHVEPVYATSYSPEAIWNITIGNGIILKLFLDSIVYYAVVLVVSVVLLLSALSEPFRYRMRKHKLGHIGALLCFAFLVVFWIVYWTFYFGPFHRSPEGDTWSERLGRSSGQLCNLFLAFTFIPASRNSVFHALAGVSFDSIIIYHRWLGTCFVGSVVLHLVFWVWNWISLGRLINIISLHQIPHSDNFSVATVLIVFVTAIVPMSLTSIAFVRRNYHHIFFAVHHLFIVIVIASTIHAWSLWMVLAPSLTMYLINRGISQYRTACSNSQIISAQHINGHTRIVLTAPFHFQPGQFVYLCVPNVSLLEWVS